MKKRLAKKIFRNKDRYPFHTVKASLRRLFPPGILRLYMPVLRIIEENSLKDISEIDDDEFLAHVEKVVSP